MESKLIAHIFVQWLANKGLLDIFLDSLIRRIDRVTIEQQNSYETRVIAALYKDPGEALYIIPWGGCVDINWAEISAEWRIFTYKLYEVIAHDDEHE